MPDALQSARTDAVPISPPVSRDHRQWVHLLPTGRITTVDGRGPYTADDSGRIITASFSLARATSGRIPVDYNHSLDLAAPKGLPSPAAGWISEMETRPDGIWGLVEWTPGAARAIGDREYRFLSPVIHHTDKKRVMAIARASLTNTPNLTLTALNAAEKGTSMDHEELLASLRTTLGLPDDADSAAILDAVKKTLESRNSADPARFVPIGIFRQTVDELQRLRSGVSLQAAETEVDRAIEGGDLLPFMRDWAVSLCQANKAAYDDFMGGEAGGSVRTFVKSLHTPKILGEDGRGRPILNPDFPQSLSARAHESARRGTGLSDVQRNLGHTTEDVATYGGETR